MQDELTMFALILLILAHGILIRSCYSLHTSIPAESQVLRKDLGDVRELLDEALDLIADVAPSAQMLQTSNPGQPESLGANILTSLISNMLMPKVDGSETQQKEREIYEVEYPQTQESTD